MTFTIRDTGDLSMLEQCWAMLDLFNRLHKDALTEYTRLTSESDTNSTNVQDPFHRSSNEVYTGSGDEKNGIVLIKTNHTPVPILR